MSTIRVHIKVIGKVQAVGYRLSAQEQAKRLGLVGWVKNMPDGSVELECEGQKERVDEFLKWCKLGPRFGEVRNVEVTSQDVIGDENFEIL